MVEALVEDATGAILQELDKHLGGDDPIPASNTSVIPIMKLDAVTRRPGYVIGIQLLAIRCMCCA